MAMRLRLLPWVWERLEISRRLRWASKKQTEQKLNAIVNGPHTNRFMAANVKYLLRPSPSRIDADFIFDEGS